MNFIVNENVARVYAAHLGISDVNGYRWLGMTIRVVPDPQRDLKDNE